MPAYIAEDECGLLGQPLVRNGIPLWKAHHAAFDIGIDPDYRLHASERLLVQKDGPLLEAIKASRGGLLRPA
jgi:putative restriction endonuclease